jgi:hypothetical protein
MGRHNLPWQVTSFVGRAAELAELRALVSGGSRLITITGPGGIGKSRLALQVAAQALDRADDGTRLVELAPVTDPELVAAGNRWVLAGSRSSGFPRCRCRQRISAPLTGWLLSKRFSCSPSVPRCTGGASP